MSGPSASASAPILVLLLVVATDLWVYADRKPSANGVLP